MSTTPRAKSSIWSNKPKQDKTCVCHCAVGEINLARKLSENKLTPSTKLIIADAIWLCEMADAKQPSDKNRQPVRKIPRYIPPTVPVSSPPDWLVKCRTMKRHASIGSHATV